MTGTVEDLAVEVKAVGKKKPGKKRKKKAAAKKRVVKPVAKKVVTAAGGTVGVVEHQEGEKAAEDQIRLGSGRTLSETAGKMLQLNRKIIAKSLVKNTIKGSVQSARLLVQLAGPCTGKTKRRRGTQSMAEELEAEPEWVGEVVEATAETSGGRREVERS